VDLFEPGSGSQVHDINGGTLASGLFWTLALDDDALRVSHDGRRAVLDVEGLQAIESYRFFGPDNTPAALSFHIEWQATDRFVDRGKGATVAATDPAAFLGRFAVARSSAEFDVSELGFSFESSGDTKQGFAELGRERNGVFLE
jgi:hypothetical protein